MLRVIGRGLVLGGRSMLHDLNLGVREAEIHKPPRPQRNAQIYPRLRSDGSERIRQRPAGSAGATVDRNRAVWRVKETSG